MQGGVLQLQEGNRCDEDQFSVPTVAPDGIVYVAFQND